MYALLLENGFKRKASVVVIL